MSSLSLDEEVIREEYSVVEDSVERVKEVVRFIPVKRVIRVRDSGLTHYTAIAFYVRAFMKNYGYVISKGNQVYLVPFPGVECYIPLKFPEDISPPKPLTYIHVSRYKVEPVLEKGVKAKDVMVVFDWEEVEPPKIKPEMKFSEFAEIILDGVEIPEKSHEELITLEPLSTPPLMDINVKGGIHTGLVGKNQTNFASIIEKITPTIPGFYGFRKIYWNKYDPLKYRRKVKVYELGIIATNIDQALLKRVKIPGFDSVTIISEAPKPSESSAVKYVYDVKNYLLAVRTWKPIIISKKLEETLNELSKAVKVNIEKLDLPRILIGEGALIDPNWVGTPLTILRYAQAIARSKAEESPEPYLREAAEIIVKAAYALGSIIRGKYVEPPMGFLEGVVYKTIEQYKSMSEKELLQYLKINYKSLYQKTAIYHALRNLLKKGYIYIDTKRKYHAVTP